MKKIYLLAFGLLIGAGLMAQNLMVDFEDKTIGDPIPTISWGEAVAVVADDPLAAGNKVLEFTPNNYNAAPVVAFTLPEGKTLADYKQFKFKGYFAQGDVGWKHIIVTVTQDAPTGSFEHTSSLGTKIGDLNRAEGASTEWETIEIDITNELSDLSGTIYVAFGMNQAGTGDQGGAGLITKWYADDITLVYKAGDDDPVNIFELGTFESFADIDAVFAEGVFKLKNGEMEKAELLVSDNTLDASSTKMLKLVSKEASSNDWDLQLATPSIPLIEGNQYKITFDIRSEGVGKGRISTGGETQMDSQYWPHFDTGEEWTTHEYVRSAGAAGVVELNFDMGTIANMTYFIDNIKVIDLTPSVSINSIVKPTLNVYSSEGSITIGDALGKQIAVYSITGSKVFGTSAKSNDVTVNVPTGIYIVVVDGVAKKVAVR